MMPKVLAVANPSGGVAPRPFQSFLIVDAGTTWGPTLAARLGERGFDARFVTGVADAVAAARSRRPDVLLVDLVLGGETGLDALASLRRLDETVPVLFVSDVGSVDAAVRAMRRGAAGFLVKPIDVDRVLDELAVARLVVDHEAGRAETLDAIEWAHITRVLASCGGNKSEAARRLGIARKTLQRKLDQGPPRDRRDVAEARAKKEGR